MGDLAVALDAMGGDKAPSEIVAGARLARDEHGIDVLLVGPTDGSLGDISGFELFPSSEVVTMDEDPTRAVRQKKDSSLVKAAEAVRDGRASAMVSAGNTGAAMAAALLRMGRLKGVARPGIATPLVVPADLSAPPTVLVDAGANAECQASWLVQFAQMASAYVRLRYGTAEPSIGLLSNGEEASKGSPLVKQAHALLAATQDLRFAGNVEGRDLLAGKVDVVVTDGFTGNVALKALEGALATFMGILSSVIGSSPETRAAGDVLVPGLLPYATAMDPESTGGALLLGVDGVCVISHGSSSARAVSNAVKLGHDMAAAGLVESLREAVDH